MEKREIKGLLRRLFSFIIIICVFASAYGVTTLQADAQSLSGTIIVGGSVTSSSHVTLTDTFYASNLDCASLNGAKIIYYAPVYGSDSVSGFSQTINSFEISADPAPTVVSGIQTDTFGNRYKKYEWSLDGFTGSKTIVVRTNFDVTSTGNPAPEAFTEARPSSLPSGMYQYVNPSEMVQSTNGEIVSVSSELVSGAATEAEAVDRIMNYVRTHIPDQSSGVSKDAVSSLHSSSGTCVNRANLALGLLRAANIPARYVNGIVSDNPSIKAPFVMSGSEGYATFQWGKELHAWVEVYYPQKGVWVAYDPWMTKGFVDQRHVKTGIALDSNMNDKNTGGFIETFNYENVNSGASGSVSTSITFSNVQDSGSYTSRSLNSNPAGALMMGRDMVNAPTPTPTATPAPTATPQVNVTITPTPNANATITPTPNATVTITPTPLTNASVTPTPVTNASLNVTAIPDPVSSGSPAGNGTTTDSSISGNGLQYFITGLVMDDKTGMRIGDAAITVDGIPVEIDSAGAFTTNVTAGNHTIGVSAPGYGNGSLVVMVTDKDVPVVLKMQKAGTSTAGNSLFGVQLPGFELILALAGILIAGLCRYGRT